MSDRYSNRFSNSPNFDGHRIGTHSKLHLAESISELEAGRMCDKKVYDDFKRGEGLLPPKSRFGRVNTTVIIVKETSLAIVR